MKHLLTEIYFEIPKISFKVGNRFFLMGCEYIYSFLSNNYITSLC